MLFVFVILYYIGPFQWLLLCYEQACADILWISNYENSVRRCFNAMSTYDIGKANIPKSPILTVKK